VPPVRVILNDVYVPEIDPIEICPPVVGVINDALVIILLLVGLMVIGEVALDAVDVPLLFVAVTVKVYAVPATRPPIPTEFVVPVEVIPPGLLVTVYAVIVPFPLDAVKVMSATVLLAT